MKSKLWKLADEVGEIQVGSDKGKKQIAEVLEGLVSEVHRLAAEVLKLQTGAVSPSAWQRSIARPRPHEEIKEWLERIGHCFPCAPVAGTSKIVLHNGIVLEVEDSGGSGACLKMEEHGAMLEYLAHCANNLPALLTAAREFRMLAGKGGDITGNEHVDVWNKLNDAIDAAAGCGCAP